MTAIGILGVVALLAAIFARMPIGLALALTGFLGDVTSDLSIPKIVYWIPVLLGIGASALATLVFIARWRRAP